MYFLFFMKEGNPSSSYILILFFENLSYLLIFVIISITYNNFLKLISIRFLYSCACAYVLLYSELSLLFHICAINTLNTISYIINS